MLSQHTRTLSSLSPADAAALRKGLNLDPGLTLTDALVARRHDQADIVLTLLHAGRHAAVQQLMGRPIIVFPAQASPQELQARWHRECEQRMVERVAPSTSSDDRVIRVSVPVCPLRIPSARARWELLEKCRTVGAYVQRVSRWRALRDIREWGAQGWLEVA